MILMKQLYRKRKSKFALILLSVFGCTCFLLSQFLYLLRLNEDTSQINRESQQHHKQNVAINKIMSKWNESKHSKLVKDKDGNTVSLRGTNSRDIGKYLPNLRGNFICIASKKEIDFLKINDNYCDCPLDGSDEPGTNACNNGVFYCEVSSKKFPAKIASYKVNDGVCDCCDGSDEWSGISLHDTSANNQPSLQGACLNRC
ncbi:uncharacterized protein LOC122512959 isoform X2 [Leptopilina heterotoma]|uniref:uncharacterized protein LOC122512959 isoform X2 n=1 Tax=Leptopilina heterotoma TaxID=63436 RepID=UPI001CA8F61D|nr:uncharacterized protein LOC122512959 isoform X2 [Leptopilina heterotoma]